MPDNIENENVEVTLNELKTHSPKYFYLDVEMDFMGNPVAEKLCFTKEIVKVTIMNIVKKIFGEYGNATIVDVLQVDKAKKRIILRCPSEFYVKLRSCITMITHYESHECSFHVRKASNLLISLAYNSCTYEHLESKA